MLRAAAMNAPQATRESAEPTEIRRTPRSVSRDKVRSGAGRETMTFTGFGATAFTIAEICSASLIPGA